MRLCETLGQVMNNNTDSRNSDPVLFIFAADLDTNGIFEQVTYCHQMNKEHLAFFLVNPSLFHHGKLFHD